MNILICFCSCPSAVIYVQAAQLSSGQLWSTAPPPRRTNFYDQGFYDSGKMCAILISINNAVHTSPNILMYVIGFLPEQIHL